MVRPAYPLVTARLKLRPFAAADFEDLYAINSRPDVTRYLYSEPGDAAQVREVLDQKIGESMLDEVGQRLSLAVVRPELNRVIGEVHLQWLSREHRQGEIGFVFHPDHHGKGFATEAAAVVLQLGFADLGLHRIIGRLDAGTSVRPGYWRSSACDARRTSCMTSSSRANGPTSSSTRSSSTSGRHGAEFLPHCGQRTAATFLAGCIVWVPQSVGATSGMPLDIASTMLRGHIGPGG
ncbi:GNAT family N-acetyltransferase [Kribbella caucasensis]|uniref:GNAT family N-acetyltransferase n=1 Tax=Kribbella caucasensis TaxID=2512215 RepID=UPI001EDCA504|nr:GNAT family N-acetyltransferase [Kribbella sp. VKM Ac-2527]